MDLPTRCLLENRAWADEMHATDPLLFEQMAAGQQPGVFWIGCADSRVPAERITNAAPGELFVHRAIANLALPEDNSLMSALQYAIEALRVQDVVVCGHDACGGVRAAMLPPSPPAAGPDGGPGATYLAERIRPLRELYRQHRREVEAVPAGLSGDDRLAAQVDRMVTVNVRHQLLTLAEADVVRAAWSRGQALRLHGWVYGLRDGRLREVLSIDGAQAALARAA